MYICLSWKNYSIFYDAIKDGGGNIKNCIVWKKDYLGLGYADYRPQHELIFYTEGKWHGDKSQSDVWEFSRASTASYVHPTQKPIGLVARGINNSSKQDDIVLDLFGGSGSTLIACEQLDRTCYMMELDPKYCDVIRKRYDNFIQNNT